MQFLFNFIKRGRLREISIGTKLRIFGRYVKSLLLYGYEMWKVIKWIKRDLQTFLVGGFKKIFKIFWPNIFLNGELWRHAQEKQMAVQIILQKWKWIGHMMRKDSTAIEKWTLIWNPQGQSRKEDWGGDHPEHLRQKLKQWEWLGERFR